MDIKRAILYGITAFVGVLLWNAWMHDNPTQPAKPVATQQAQSQSTLKKQGDGFAPQAFTPTHKVAPNAITATSPKSVTVPVPAKGEIIQVKTDVLNIGINTDGGNVVSANLPKYKVSLKKDSKPIQILNPDQHKIYVAQSGITNTTVDGKTQPIQYSASQLKYALQPGQKKLEVVLTGKSANGLTVTKTYIFRENHYSFQIHYDVTNNTGKQWKGSIYNQLLRKNVPVAHSFHHYSYDGGSYSTNEKPYEKLTYKKLNEKNIDATNKGGWVAMQQQYFLSAFVPNQKDQIRYYSHVIGPQSDKTLNKIYVLGYVQPEMTLAPGASAKAVSTIYIGPEIAKRLKILAKGLDLTIDYGWLWPISKLIFWVLSQLYNLVGNWGWSIILVTLLIKVVFYWFSDKSYKSMAKMRAVQPKVKALQERLKEDKPALSKAMMELYKKEKVNPMGSCLPMIIQIPVFIALYYVLIESVQLRHAPFIFWIHDLSVKDPFYVLPVLMGISMFVQQKMSPAPPDPTQAKIMMFLPVIFTVFFATFPAGLVLYWLTNNVLSLVQQWYVFKTFDPKAAAQKARYAKKKR